MSISSIARRFERRAGYELIDFAPVALPIYRLTVETVTMAHREISPIKEFVMRAIAAGLDDEGNVRGFLGLDEATVHSTFDQLLDDRYIAADENGSGATLAKRGHEVLTKARESSPQEEMLVFLYDRLLRKPIRLAADQLLAPANIDAQRVIEIRPYPADGPDVSDLSIPEVGKLLEQEAGGSAAFGRDILRIKRIVRRVRLYRPAVGLVYKKIRSSDIQIAFIVDDARHEGLEHAFAVGGGPKRMGFVRSIDESATTSELRRYIGPEVTRLLPDKETLDEKRLQVSMGRIKQQACLTRLARKGGAASADAKLEKEQLELATQALAHAESELREFPARPILPFEIGELFEQALSQAQRSLFISSRDVQKAFIDKRFIERLEFLLAKGVRVVIALGEPATSPTVAAELERVRRRYPKLELSTKRRSVFYHLICDEAFALVCNTPFLSNEGKVRIFHHVVGMVLQAPALVAAFTARVDPASRNN